MRGLGGQGAEGKCNNKRGERARRRRDAGRRGARSKLLEREGRRRTDRSELSNLVLPKVPDISLHHKLAMPPSRPEC